MDKYRVSVFCFDYEDGRRLLMCYAFMINPVDSLDDCVAWINSLDRKPDFIKISYKDGSCLFDNEDTRIVNNIFYCNRY